MTDLDIQRKVAESCRKTMLYTWYIKGGGSPTDFVTDIGYVIEAHERVLLESLKEMFLDGTLEDLLAETESPKFPAPTVDLIDH